MNAFTGSTTAYGRPAPLGATCEGDGVNFAIYSAHAERVEVCLFDERDGRETARLTLAGQTGSVFHGFVPGLLPGQHYGFRVHGRYEPHAGHRFNANKLLVDPYARLLSGPVINNDANFGYVRGHPEADLSFDERDNAAFMPKCIVVGEEAGPEIRSAPLVPWHRTIIYELHVAGMTRRHDGVPEALRGTFAGLASEAVIGQFKALGITAIELLPIFPFADEPHLTEKGLTNYWGYNTYSFLAPEPRFASGPARAEMRDLVRRYHDAGIEVILDVVYNHTAEGWHLGPTFSFRGIDNKSYYRLVPDAPRYYIDDTGCGNTLAADREPALSLIVDSLRHWVEAMGVDGFRFDLAATLARTETGFSPDAPLMRAIATDPVLSGVKLIAEPWDVGPGGYRLGGFTTGSFAEWNDCFRNDVRGFWRGDAGRLGAIGTRLTGSADLFRRHPLGPQASLNFITAHDGFTLNDLVSYEHKHNEANAEENRDGQNNNVSANHGVEGATNDPAILATRERQMRNMLATLLVSQGLPMLLAGDEIGHSQQGNNNAYCQDNELTWIDWSRADSAEARHMQAFLAMLVDLRHRLPALRQTAFLTGAPREGETLKDASWWSPEGREMTVGDWQRHSARTIGLHLAAVADPDSAADMAKNVGNEDGLQCHVLILMNAHDEAVDFRLPPAEFGSDWQVLADTAVEVAPPVPRHLGAGDLLALQPRSLVLMSVAGPGGICREAAATAPSKDWRDRPVEPATLDRLSRQAGLELSYWDLKGRECWASYDTKRSLLGAMGFSIAGEREAQDALRTFDLAPWRQLIGPTTVLRPGLERKSTLVPLNIPAPLIGRSLSWQITLENGQMLRGESPARKLATLDTRLVDGCDIIQLGWPLPYSVPFGRHQLSIEIGERQGTGALIVAPPHSYQPAWIGDGRSQWGLACQLYGLRRGENHKGFADPGIGEMTQLRDLARLVGLADGGAMGISPLHALFLSEPHRASPYSPSSRLFLNPLYIDATACPEFAISEAARNLYSSAPRPTGRSDLVDYETASRAKLAVLKELFSDFETCGAAGTHGARRAAFDRFVARGGTALEDFATFQALEERFGPPSGWPAEYARATAPAVAAFAGQSAEQCRFYKFLQFEIDRQLADAADTARKSGMKIGLYGDFAVGTAPDGAELWSNGEAFARSCRFGAPPDPFSDTGQDWGMPPMNPHHFAENGYQDFAAMIATNMRHCGALRLDHVMWLERMFWIPEGGTAKDGAYVRYPRDDLLGVLALESHRHSCIVVGEDLGTVPLGFRECMTEESILSYRFLRFERFPDGLFCRPDTYPRIALATPASHDLATLRGFWEGRDIEAMQDSGLISSQEAASLLNLRGQERAQLIAALADQHLLPADFPADPALLSASSLEALINAAHRFLGRSPACIVMANIEDLAGVADQSNLPGTIDSYPNWRRRLPLAVNDPSLVRRLRETAALMAHEGRPKLN